MQLVLASRNQGKIKEFRDLLQPLGYDVLTPTDFPGLGEVVEDGRTFYDNARKKAEVVSAETGLPALADDSGLVVHYLGGLPGVRSARFSEPEHSDMANNQKLLQMLQGVPEHKRQAHFVAVLAWARPGMPTRFTIGRCFGSITSEARGAYGFGYDPLFLLSDFGQTMAELDMLTKNRISHRAKAMQRMRQLMVSER